MSLITVEKVSDNGDWVDILVENVLLHFWLEMKKNSRYKLCYTKGKPGAQVYDRAQLEISEFLFRKACRMAWAVLLGRQRRQHRQQPAGKNPAPVPRQLQLVV